MPANSSIRHAVYVQRYGADVMRKMMRVLNRADADLMRKIRDRVESGRGDTLTTSRLQGVLSDVRAITTDSYQQFGRNLTNELHAFGVYEGQFQQGLLQSFVPVRIAAVPAELVAAAVTAEPFQGRLLSEWVEGLSATRYNRLRDAIRIGVVEGQTTDEMVRVIRGTASQGFADGILEVDRRGAAAFVRTSVNHVSNEARQAVWQANADIISGIQWLSTLDHRTCPECQANDGKVFEIEAGPRPPAHINCRCTTVPKLKGELDAFQGTRPAVGPGGVEHVPAGTTYGQWLAKQPAAFQDDTLGPARGALFRRGGVSLDRFVDRRGGELTLDQLRQRQPEAFKEAGL
jgi:SPP1 gp7 family putative phage head morphogenesis protein